MTDAEIEARAEVIVDAFLDNAVDSEVSAEAKAEIVGKIGGMLKSGVTMLASVVLPALVAVIGMKLAAPWICQLMNGGMPCPFYSPMYLPPPPPKKPAAAPAAAA